MGGRSYEHFTKGVAAGMQMYGGNLTHEALLSYHADQLEDGETEKTELTDTLVRPCFKAASSRNPISGRMEYYLGVGIQPSISSEELNRRRNPLCVVFVVDVSGSMAKAYDYLADGGEQTKLAAAKKLVGFIGKHLLGQMEYSIVAYRASHDSKVPRDAKVLRAGEQLEELEKIEGFGGSDLLAAMTDAKDEMKALQGRLRESNNSPSMALSCRYILLSDAKLPDGKTEKEHENSRSRREYEEYEDRERMRKADLAKAKDVLEQLLGLISEEAAGDCYTVMFSMAMPPDDAEAWRRQLRGVKGCNFAEVSGSIGEFTRNLSKEFATLISPIATDFSLELHAAPFEIDKVIGWQPPPGVQLHTREGEFLRFVTIFPFLPGVKLGGLYLMRLRPIDFGDASKADKVKKDLTLSWEYRDINGELLREKETISFTKIVPRNESESARHYAQHEADDSEYQNIMMRKMMMCVRFVDFVNDECTYHFNRDNYSLFKKYWRREQTEAGKGKPLMTKEIETIEKYVADHVDTKDSCTIL